MAKTFCQLGAFIFFSFGSLSICERTFKREILSFWYCWGPIQSRILVQTVFGQSIWKFAVEVNLFEYVHVNCFPNFSSDLVCSFESYLGPPPPPVLDYCGRGGANCRCFLYNKINIPTIIGFSFSSVKLDVFNFLDAPAVQEITLLSGHSLRIISQNLK